MEDDRVGAMRLHARLAAISRANAPAVTPYHGQGNLCVQARSRA
jgi:porphobilinogen deaminase